MTAEPIPALVTKQHSALKIPAYILSYVFHPLFIPAYVMAYLVYLHPYAYAGLPEKVKFFRLISVFFNTGFAPAFAVFLMWRLRLIETMFLKTRKERIIPYAASMIFYFWAWYVFYKQGENPDYQVKFLLGTFLAVCASWILNIYTKISMHATAMGGMVLFFLLQAFTEYEVTAYYFTIALIIAGLVCTARLIVSDHTPREIYLGLFIGALCQLIALVV